jgi:hypothetical protein
MSMDAEKSLSASAQRVQLALAAAGVATGNHEMTIGANVGRGRVGFGMRSWPDREIADLPRRFRDAGAGDCQRRHASTKRSRRPGGRPIGKADAGFVRLVTGMRSAGSRPLDMRSACPRSSIATC